MTGLFLVVLITNKYEIVLYKYKQLNFILLKDQLLKLKISILIILFHGTI